MHRRTPLAHVCLLALAMTMTAPVAAERIVVDVDDVRREVAEVVNAFVPSFSNKLYVGSYECIEFCFTPYHSIVCGYGAVCFWGGTEVFDETLPGWQSQTATFAIHDFVAQAPESPASAASPIRVGGMLCLLASSPVIAPTCGGVGGRVAIFCDSVTISTEDGWPVHGNYVVIPLGAEASAYYAACPNAFAAAYGRVTAG